MGFMTTLTPELWLLLLVCIFGLAVFACRRDVAGDKKNRTIFWFDSGDYRGLGDSLAAVSFAKGSVILQSGSKTFNSTEDLHEVEVRNERRTRMEGKKEISDDKKDPHSTIFQFSIVVARNLKDEWIWWRWKDTQYESEGK